MGLMSMSSMKGIAGTCYDKNIYSVLGPNLIMNYI